MTQYWLTFMKRKQIRDSQISASVLWIAGCLKWMNLCQMKLKLCVYFWTLPKWKYPESIYNVCGRSMFLLNFFALLVIDNFTQVPTPFMPFDHFSFMLHLKFLTHSSKKIHAGFSCMSYWIFFFKKNMNLHRVINSLEFLFEIYELDCLAFVLPDTFSFSVCSLCCDLRILWIFSGSRFYMNFRNFRLI